MTTPEPRELICAGLRYVSWEITRRCDARCVHCYAGSGPEVPIDGDLSTAEALALIDQLAAAGEMILAFSGGEPLLRPDWCELMGHAVERDLVVTLVTNGSRVDDEVAGKLAALGLQSVTVSLDSHRPEVHDRIRRLDGLHARALGAIRRLAGLGVRVVVNFTPIRDNRDDARGVVELAYQLGAAAVSLSEYAPAGRGTREMGLDAGERERLAAEWLALAAEYRGRVHLIADNRTVSLLATAGAPGSDRGCPDCGAGRAMLRITPEGAVTPCTFVPDAFGSLRAVPFPELWLETRERRLAVPGSPSCATCGMLVSIGGG
jgi:radical SAM protein with 4Fe4S-binding SPASM domain